jgi:hypothetical protein
MIREISITPIQVHPGSKITALNTFAKALEITKGLPLKYDREEGMDKKILNLKKAQETYVSALREVGDGVTLPEDVLSTHIQISKAVEVDPPAAQDPPKQDPPKQDKPAVQQINGDEIVKAVAKAVSEAVAPLQMSLSGGDPNPHTDPEKQDITSQITKAVEAAITPIKADLDKLRGIPAPLRGKTSMSDPGAPPPRSEGGDGGNKIDRAIEKLTNLKSWPNGRRSSDLYGIGQETAMKLVMARSQRKPSRQAGKMRIEGMSLNQTEIDFLNNS